MPKKMGTNSKAEAARERRAVAESEKKGKEARDKDDQYWREAEGTKSRAAKKREEEAEKRMEAAARKAEIRKLAEKEQLELERAAKKPDKKANRVAAPVPKVTTADLDKRRDEERAKVLKNADVEKKKVSRMAEEEEYERVVMVKNVNRDDSLIEAHSVDEALKKMAVSEPGLLPDRHPEKRLKASFMVSLFTLSFLSVFLVNF